MNNLITIILVASLGVIGNIVYFEYRLKKDHRRDILKRRLTDLLLPLYYALKNDELEIYEWINSDVDIFEYESDKPKRVLNKLKEIIKENLYLADDELHNSCLTFIEWAYKSDEKERFQRIHSNTLEKDIIFEKFINIVYKRYYETRKEYINLL